MSNQLTTAQIKERIENAFPDLILGWDIEDRKPNIINKSHGHVIAYTYHKKWILTPSISDYAYHIGAIIALLEKWDGEGIEG